MRTHVEFRSDAFPAQPGEDEEINPGRWGKLLAAFLRAELTKAGLVGGEPYAEDWGWEIPINNPEFGLFVGCGNYEEYPDGFLCFVDPSKPYIRKLFRKIDTTARGRRARQNSLGPSRHTQCALVVASRVGHLTNRWSGRVEDKVPSPNVGVRAAQLNR